MGDAQRNWLKLILLTKFLFAKLLAWGLVRSRGLKELEFSKSGLINRSRSKPQRSCLFK